jgi:chemotaxis protein methyltransferase CheR
MNPVIHLAKPPANLEDSCSLSQPNYEFLQRWIHRESGIQVGSDKLYLFQSRLVPVAKSESLGSLDALCAQLRGSPSEQLRRKVVEAMTTHETLFFRDPGTFDALGNVVLPELTIARQPARRLRIWSAACSSGQEAYSLAMLLLEKGFAGWDVEILATDLSAQILDRARSAVYYQNEINRGLPAAMLLKYFDKNGPHWQIKQAGRNLVRFAIADLRNIPAGFGPFDLVLCRNVLIYFDAVTKKKVLDALLRTLAPGGLLLLGAAESTIHLDAGTSRRRIGTTVFYHTNSAHRS